MARIRWVMDRLDNWARWATQRDRGASGYPKISAFARAARSAQSTDSMMIPFDDVEASRTHQAVERLRGSHSHLWLAVQCTYIGDPQAAPRYRRPMSTPEIAARMCIGDRAVQARLEVADVVLSGLIAA